MRDRGLLLVVLVIQAMTLAAAISGAKGSGVMGRSSYKQPYQVPIMGAVPPLKPSIYNDEFSAQHPTNALDSGFVDPNSAKWSVWDHGGVLGYALINPRMQMLQMSSGGIKAWAGLKQSLPIPTQGSPVSYAVLARAFNSDFGTREDFDGYFFGMMFAEDATDSAGELYGLNTSLVRAAGVVFGGTEVMKWPSYDGLTPSPDAEMSTGWPADYWRAIVQSSFDGAAYVTSLQCDASVNGLGFAELYRYTGLDFPFRHLVLGQRGEGVDDQPINQTIMVDYVRLFTEDIDLDTTGRLQQLGST